MLKERTMNCATTNVYYLKTDKGPKSYVLKFNFQYVQRLYTPPETKYLTFYRKPVIIIISFFGILR